MLRKLTLEPETVGPSDVDLVRASGVSDESIRDAIYVCALFNIIDRVADALSFRVSSPEAFAKSAKTLLKRGYE